MLAESFVELWCGGRIVIAGENLWRRYRGRGWLLFSDKRSAIGILGEFDGTLYWGHSMWIVWIVPVCVEEDSDRRECRQANRSVPSVCRDPGSMDGGGKQFLEVAEMMGKELAGSYTVETAGVMAVVLFTVMILLNQAFHVRAETVGKFTVHEAVERERHEIAYRDRREITKQERGMRWGIELTSPVFCPEESLRMWSLAE